MELATKAALQGALVGCVIGVVVAWFIVDGIDFFKGKR